MTEAAYLVGQLLGSEAEAAFLRALADGQSSLQPVEPADLHRAAALIDTYSDLHLGTVDAAVVAVAERLGETQIATLDRRHFTVVRPAHVDHFELLP